MSEEKDCKDCGRRLPLGEFYAHPGMADGRLNSCKRCRREYQATRLRGPDAEKLRERDRLRFHENPERRAYAYASARRHTRENPEKKAARSAVSAAIRGGRLVRQPCVVCGSPLSEAHHADYSKPLEVEWYCKLHHEAVHHDGEQRQERSA